MAVERFQVLVIDDDPNTARATARGLTRTCDASLSYSAEEGLARLRAGEHFDLVVCDVMMPGMKGTDFFLDAIALSPEMRSRIVLVTGGASPAQMARITELGARCLQKPILIETLQALAASAGKLRP